jgi:hypothetical protein
MFINYHRASKIVLSLTPKTDVKHICASGLFSQHLAENVEFITNYEAGSDYCIENTRKNILA